MKKFYVSVRFEIEGENEVDAIHRCEDELKRKGFTGVTNGVAEKQEVPKKQFKRYIKRDVATLAELVRSQDSTRFYDPEE